jgi:hypothetical protein
MSKVNIAERIFNVVRDTPGLTEENIHEVMSVDVKYKTVSGKSLIYRMLRAKFLRKDKNGKFFAHIDAYKPLPAYKPKKKKPVTRDAVLAEAAKLNQTAQAQYRESAAMNAYRHPPVTYVKLNPPAKKSFFTKLRELFA